MAKYYRIICQGRIILLFTFISVFHVSPLKAEVVVLLIDEWCLLKGIRFQLCLAGRADKNHSKDFFFSVSCSSIIKSQLPTGGWWVWPQYLEK